MNQTLSQKVRVHHLCHRQRWITQHQKPTISGGAVKFAICCLIGLALGIAAALAF